MTTGLFDRPRGLLTRPLSAEELRRIYLAYDHGFRDAETIRDVLQLPHAPKTILNALNRSGRYLRRRPRSAAPRDPLPAPPGPQVDLKARAAGEREDEATETVPLEAPQGCGLCAEGCFEGYDGRRDRGVAALGLCLLASGLPSCVTTHGVLRGDGRACPHFRRREGR